MNLFDPCHDPSIYSMLPLHHCWAFSSAVWIDMLACTTWFQCHDWEITNIHNSAWKKLSFLVWMFNLALVEAESSPSQFTGTKLSWALLVFIPVASSITHLWLLNKATSSTDTHTSLQLAPPLVSTTVKFLFFFWPMILDRHHHLKSAFHPPLPHHQWHHLHLRYDHHCLLSMSHPGCGRPIHPLPGGKSCWWMAVTMREGGW